jgi:hypothetical protein
MASPRTPAELEAEITDLRARLARAEKTIDRLLSEPTKVEVHKEVLQSPYPGIDVPFTVNDVKTIWNTAGCATTLGDVWVGTTMGTVTAAVPSFTTVVSSGLQ